MTLPIHRLFTYRLNLPGVEKPCREGRAGGRGRVEDRKDGRDRLWGRGPYGTGEGGAAWHASLTHFACFKKQKWISRGKHEWLALAEGLILYRRTLLKYRVNNREAKFNPVA